MAAVLLSSTEFAQQLEEVGMPQAQAKVVAQGLAAMYVQHFDALVTKDYLDTRFAEFESRTGRELDRHTTEIGRQLTAMEASIDRRFAEQQARIDQRFTEQQAGMDQRFAKIDQRFAEQQAGFNQRFVEQQAGIDQRFAEQKAEFNQRFADVETRFARVNVMLAVILAALAVPVLQAVLVWTA